MSKYKKIIVVMITLCLTLSLSGCNNVVNTSEIQSTNKSEEIPPFTEEITKEELEKINSDIKVIIQSLNNRDVESMKTLFDDTTLQKVTSFDERMKYVFDMLDGNIVNVEERKLNKVDSSGLVESEWYYIYISYDIYTETNIYPLDVVYVCNKKMKIEDTGVYSINISDLDREDEYYEYLNGKTSVAGIFSTEIDTIEYNHNELWSYYSKIEDFEPIMASSTAVELSRVGIEKIHIENLEVSEEGWMSITLVDEMNFKYLVETDEYGYVNHIYENDSEGRVLFYRIE